MEWLAILFLIGLAVLSNTEREERDTTKMTDRELDAWEKGL